MSKEILKQEPFNPKKIFDKLIERCRSAKRWEIRCIVDESWTGIAPFDIIIIDGIFHCYVVSPELSEAYMLVAEKLPVITFLEHKDEDGS